MEANEPFADVLRANEAHARRFRLKGLARRAAKELAVLTCIDPRVDPLPILGLAPGEAAILRNAGARVTDDVVRTLVVASYLLGVRRLMVLAHTRCGLTAESDDVIRAAVRAAAGPDTSDLTFLANPHQEAALREDVQRARSSPYLASLQIGGFLYDVDTGRLTQIC